MKKLTYDVKYRRLNIISDEGDEIVHWKDDGSIPDVFLVIRELIQLVEGGGKIVTAYTKSPEGHMADSVISILQGLRGVLLEMEQVKLISSGNSDVADLIKDTLADDQVGESGLTKTEYVEISSIFNSLADWVTTDVVLPDATTITPKEVIMKAYEIN